ncbi:hypothetical protein [Streptomyces spectabilis]|uniref:N-acetyl-beta-hexosaminidase n=1 Tax=Streptomyces spectabilis TaxID=68270 RepID=A0A5P2XLG6_STRST|nr:hypothetical protein [Streptomyces spectabilis]MBB5102306.1 N-acetyl-beta-hexosaminidase [Streptomyces spectabilis]MCI3907354.1 hypothetical protein [Streptomyces spectabilis]QEV64079.1 hypothetical protein CP982_39750 [Streptomyces spectabilis]GGV30014.1 hypothetical protein GCM10010245_48800 [Streptomyces spectabilis]
MDVHALRSALRASGVPDGYHWIEGVHEPVPTPPDFVYLRGDGQGAWEVGTYERGAWQPLARGLDEAEACRRMLRLLT